MKWAALGLMLAAIVPLAAWLRARPARIEWVFIVIGLLPFVTQVAHLYMAVVSWPTWVGYCKGIEISLLDFLAAGVFLSTRKAGPTPFLMSMLLYLTASILSAFQALYPMAAVFYCWQFVRMIFLYSVVYRAVVSNFGCARALLIGMGLGEILEMVISLLQRTVLGVLQANGSMDSQNELGLVSHFLLFPFFALMLGGRRGWLSSLVVFASVVVDVLTTSRGTEVLAVVGLGITLILSSSFKWSSRKVLIAALGVVAFLIAAPLAWSSFEQRFAKSKGGVELSEDAERLAYKRAAEMMVSDFPGGVGANHFALMGNVAGYYDRAGVAPYESGRAGNVHNLYYLITAETGYIGLLSFVFMVALPLVNAFKYGLRHLGDPSGDLLLGLGMTLLIAYVHSWEEWVSISFTMQYFFALNFGLIAGLVAPYRQSDTALAPVSNTVRVIS